MVTLTISSSAVYCVQLQPDTPDIHVQHILYIPLTHDVTDLLFNSGELAPVFKTAFDTASQSIDFSRETITVAIDDALLIHDGVEVESTLDEAATLDYIRWVAKQQWDIDDDNRAIEVYTQHILPKPSPWHILGISSALRQVLIDSIESVGARCHWMGSYNLALAGLAPEEERIYLFDEHHYYNIFGIIQRDIVLGLVRFVSGKPKLELSLGDVDKVKPKFRKYASTHVKGDLFIVDKLSPYKRSKWRRYGYQILRPFDGTDLDIESLPEDAKTRELNVITALIHGSAPDRFLNLAEEPGVHTLHPQAVDMLEPEHEKRELESAEKDDRVEESEDDQERIERLRARQQIPETVEKVTEEEPSDTEEAIETESGTRSNKRTVIWTITWLAVISIVLWNWWGEIFPAAQEPMTENILTTAPDSLADSTAIVTDTTKLDTMKSDILGSVAGDKSESTTDISADKDTTQPLVEEDMSIDSIPDRKMEPRYPISVIGAMDRSATTVNAIKTMLKELPWDRIETLTITDQHVRASWRGDTLVEALETIAGFPLETVSQQIGAIEPDSPPEYLHQTEFNLNLEKSDITESWIPTTSMLLVLSKMLDRDDIRRLSVRRTGELPFAPFIIYLEDISQLESVIDRIPALGDNILIRKIDIDQSDPGEPGYIHLYLAVIRPLIR